MKTVKNGRMLWEMARNDMKSRYASSILGFIWIFVLPLITIGVFWVVYEMGFKNAPVSDVPYILWFSCAYIPWIFFGDLLTSGTNCLLEYSYLVKKIKFQVEILPIVKLIASFVIHMFFVAVLMAMFLIRRVPVTVYALQLLYYSVALSVYTIGWVWLLSAVCAFFKDTAQIVNIVIQIGFWMTPIIWNLQNMGAGLRKILSCNPVCYIVEGYRDSLIYHRWFWEKPVGTVLFWCITLMVYLVGRITFSRLSHFFADEI